MFDQGTSQHQEGQVPEASVTPVPRHCFPGVQRSLAEVEPVLFQVKAACAVKGLD